MRTKVAAATTKLDKSLIDRLTSRHIELLGHGFSRQTLVEDLKIATPLAAARLAVTLKKMQIRTPHQLFKMPPLDLASKRGVGMAQLYVAMVLLDDAGYSVADWWGWDTASPRTFGTYRRRAIHRRKARGTTD